MVYSERWGARHTGANWSSTAYPALKEFRKGILGDIALRPSQVYRKTDVGSCSRMLNEYSMLWMSREQEEAFKERFEAVAEYAGNIDGVINRSTFWSDLSFWVIWQQYGALFPRLPKFRVHTDIIGHSGEIPPRIGVYVPQDDPHGALQFAWTGTTADGYRGGKLGQYRTFNDIGLAVLTAVGRNGL